MFTETKTRKAAINQNPSAIALVKVCGGYKVFTDCEEIAMWERNTGRAIPKTAYVDYKRPVKATPTPTQTPEKEEKMERTKEIVESEIDAAKENFRAECAAANECCCEYAHIERMMEAAYGKMQCIIGQLKDELFALEWTKDVTIARRDEWDAIAPKAIERFGGSTTLAAIKWIAAQTKWGAGISWAQGALKKAIKMHGL